MRRLWERIEKILPLVESPAQYIGAEWNTTRKDPKACKIKFAIAFPDLYKIGMSHLGLQIIYGMLNQYPDIMCERIFMPSLDMQEQMKRHGIPLFSLENHLPAGEFDIIGFSLQTELCYTNLLAMLELAGIPLWASERRESHPLIIAGGPCAFYPEPLSDFIDLFAIGEAEAHLTQILDLYARLKQNHTRADILFKLATRIPGVYVPRFYRFHFNTDNTIASIDKVHPEVPLPVSKAIIESMDEAYYPTDPIVPYPEIVHDRINLEIMRGCPHRCRFCQAVNLKNRLRFRSVDQLLTLAEKSYKGTGYDEIALSSLSSSDYPWLMELMVRLNARFKTRGVNISLPSLRVDDQLNRLPGVLKVVRKSTFTLAPEAGSEPLRMLIRKPMKDEEMKRGFRSIFENGWRHVKLYFMIGLPGETPNDIEGIIQMARCISKIGKEVTGTFADVNVTVSPLVPKPHTPFQWLPYQGLEYLQRVMRQLVTLAKGSRLYLKIHDPKKALIETILSRGDRRLSKVLVTAKDKGCIFDEWSESFKFERWMEAFQEAGINPDFYSFREVPVDEVLPWDHIDCGVSKGYLIEEYKQAVSLAEGLKQ
jgi:radical SAM family uncharacterized protein